MQKYAKIYKSIQKYAIIHKNFKRMQHYFNLGKKDFFLNPTYGRQNIS